MKRIMLLTTLVHEGCGSKKHQKNLKNAGEFLKVYWFEQMQMKIIYFPW